MNRELARGKHLLLTPGVYGVERSIRIQRAHTIVLGLGLPTLTAVNGAVRAAATAAAIRPRRPRSRTSSSASAAPTSARPG